MIEKLYIKDFALIDELTIEVASGLCIITGETGAGKSILIGALNMVLGERANTHIIRTGAKKAIAEAFISIDDVHQQLITDILGADAPVITHQIRLKREIQKSGSKAFVNGSPVSVQQLKEVGDLLVDLHGQHDHQLLLKAENHIRVIDGFDAVKPYLLKYQRCFSEVKQLEQQLKDLIKKEKEFKEKQQLYEFQLQELIQAKLYDEEEDELATEMKKLDNAEDMDRQAALITEIGNGDEVNISMLIAKLKQAVQELATMDESFETYIEEVSAAQISLQETIRFAENYRENIEFNPQRLEELRQRHTFLRNLQKKYTRTIPELIEYRDTLKGELEQKADYSSQIDQIKVDLQKLEQALAKAGIDLHNKRKEQSEITQQHVVEKLAEMGIPSADLKIEVNYKVKEHTWLALTIDGQNLKVNATEDGLDEVFFLVNMNKGESLKPLSDIASGGEISRVMLALKSALAHQQRLPVMIFDEIDTGISGKISEKVGVVMKKLADKAQILAITHQPQIACQADRHYKVYKEEKDGRSKTYIQALEGEEHIIEVATLMSGETLTEANIQAAREMVQRRK